MYQHALIVGKFAPLHSGHQLLIEHALAASRQLTVLCYAVPDFIHMRNEMRAGWIKSIYPAANVMVPAGSPPDSAPGPDHRRFVADFLKSRALVIDAVFTSETYGDALAEAIGAVHVSVDRIRLHHPISGTELRGSGQQHAATLDPCVWRDIADVPHLDERQPG